MKEIKNNNRGGIGFFGGLALLFIALKLCGVIEWTWVWVLAPLWISVILTIFIAILIYWAS
jgi:hypothetical protein